MPVVGLWATRPTRCCDVRPLWVSRVPRVLDAEYVDLYVDWVCNKSVASKFSAFSRGFLDVAGGPALDLFRPEELELLVIGNEVRRCGVCGLGEGSPLCV